MALSAAQLLVLTGIFNQIITHGRLGAKARKQAVTRDISMFGSTKQSATRGISMWSSRKQVSVSGLAE